MKCPECGESIAVEDTFCSACGYQLSDTEAEDPEPQQGFLDLYEESWEVRGRMLQYTWPFPATYLVEGLVLHFLPDFPVLGGETVMSFLITLIGLPAAVTLLYYMWLTRQRGVHHQI